MQDNFSRTSSEGKSKSRSCKLIKGRNGLTAVLPLSPEIGGQVGNNRPNVGQYLTREQANICL